VLESRNVVWKKKFILVDDHNRTEVGNYGIKKIPMEMRIAEQYVPFVKETTFIVYSTNGSNHYGVIYAHLHSFKKAKETAEKEIAKIERENKNKLL